MEFSLYITSCFCLTAFRILSLSLTFTILIMFWCVSLGSPYLELSGFPEPGYLFPFPDQGSFQPLFLLLFFCKFIYLFIIYFWLHWVFVAVCGFLQLQRTGVTLHCGVWASHCGGFSCFRARALGAQTSVVVAHGLRSCGLWALERKLSSCGPQAQLLCGMWDLPGPRARTRIPCMGRWILNHCAIREAQPLFLHIIFLVLSLSLHFLGPLWCECYSAWCLRDHLRYLQFSKFFFLIFPFCMGEFHCFVFQLADLFFYVIQCAIEPL